MNELKKELLLLPAVFDTAVASCAFFGCWFVVGFRCGGVRLSTLLSVSCTNYGISL